MNSDRLVASFRDPCGFVFRYAGECYRQINHAGRADYDFLMNSGLYETLVAAGLLLGHEEIEPGEIVDRPDKDLLYKVIRPKQLGFISYPWEWSFSQLQDAALVTLQIQKIAMRHGMTLKDSSAFNLQFIASKPVLIDTLSFEVLQPGRPWVAYRQFCQHFLAPLALMSRVDVRLSQLFKNNLDGIPLDLTSRLLPLRTWFSFSMLVHIHLHARSQAHFANKQPSIKAAGMSNNALLGLLDSLESGVKACRMPGLATEWGDYYSDTNYSEAAMQRKSSIVAEFIELASVQGPVWDLGANNGFFSRLAVKSGLQTVAFDIDPVAVEKNYRQCRDTGETLLLPLLQDLTNPSPALGWGNRERQSLGERGPVDLILALALIHHLAIANNLPFKYIGAFLADLCRYLIIEFVPRSDSQVQKMLATRNDIFSGYTQAEFEKEFSAFFKILASRRIDDSERVVYLLQKIAS